MDILQLIDRLEELLDRGWHVPLTNMVAIDEDAFLNIVDQMRITIPQEIKNAREVGLERDKYVAQANEEARRIIAQAREDAAKLLDEHELRAVAEKRAEELLKQARRDAARIRAGADEYTEQQLRELGQHVGELQRVIRNGLSVVEQRRAKPHNEEDAQERDDPQSEAGHAHASLAPAGRNV